MAFELEELRKQPRGADYCIMELALDETERTLRVGGPAVPDRARADLARAATLEPGGRERAGQHRVASGYVGKHAG